MKNRAYTVLSVFLLMFLCSSAISHAQETHPVTTTSYTSDAIKVFEDGTYITGDEKIRAWWAGLNNRIRDYEILETIPSHQPERITYELSGITLADGRAFRQLIIWNTEEDIPRRELEMVVESEAVEDYTKELDTRRAEWIRLCNAHNAGKLVEDLYAENALYYNHKPLVRGRQDIVSTYGYMNNPSYSLSLSPIRVVMVNQETAFEIGQCSGSYGGKYVLVWQKKGDGRWRILLDSNI